jgi:hypothetical protein
MQQVEHGVAAMLRLDHLDLACLFHLRHCHHHFWEENRGQRPKGVVQNSPAKTGILDVSALWRKFSTGAGHSTLQKAGARDDCTGKSWSVSP